MKSLPILASITSILALFSGCAHLYTDRTLSFTISKQDKSAVEALILGMYSPYHGTCVEKARERLGESLDIGKGIPPVLGSEVYCIEETASPPKNYRGVSACLFDRDSKNTQIMITASSIESSWGPNPPGPSEYATNESKRVFNEIRGAASASGIEMTQVSPEPFYQNWRICGDYR